MTSTTPNTYPPVLSEDQLSNLVFNVVDYRFYHGMLLKLGRDANSVKGVPIGVSLFPSLFPKSHFEKAQQLQLVYNKLYAAICEDEEWLAEALEGLLQEDQFTKTLWRIHQEVKKEGYIQNITLGIFRSDYMLQLRQENKNNSTPDVELKQIEFNTYSCAGGSHSNRTAEMHHHLRNTGANCLQDVEGPTLPENHTIQNLADGLSAAHAAYITSKPDNNLGKPTPCILMIVQPRNLNICDERPIEYALWSQGIPTYRVIFGQEVLSRTSIQTSSRELLYQPPSSGAGLEVAVVYMRAGYDPDEYSPPGYEARLRLERSRAIKCPSILSHLSTFKKVQQALAIPEALNRFLPDPAESARILSTFAPMYPLDTSDAGMQGRALACNPQTAINYVLKPSLEGGGHNVYRDDIPEFLQSTPESRWHTFILMRLIDPLVQRNILMSRELGMYTQQTAQDEEFELDLHSPDGRLGGPTVSELGIVGVCLWKGAEIIQNTQAGWTFKTKPTHIDEMSVVKGYGCFDCPNLVEEEEVLRDLVVGEQ